MVDLNLYAGWLGILAGILAGAVSGLFFHRDDWIGGYGSWRRRMLRLGHISFIGIALLNIAFAGTTLGMGWARPPALAGHALAAAGLLMPGVCYLAAWRKGLRHLFVLPVGCVLIATVVLLIGRIWS